MIDYEDAYKKIYGFAYDFSYHYAINILQRKIGRSEIKNESITLPAELDSEQFRKYLGKAIEAGYVIINSNGCKWVYGGNRGQARLGYFCNKAFVRPRPIDKLEELFGVKRLSSSITSADSDAKRMDVILWRKEIDDMIFGD